LAERQSDQDPIINDLREWMEKIDSSLSVLKTPTISGRIYPITKRDDGQKQTDVDMNMQGDGIQNALMIISTVLFSGKGDTIIIEEPETHLHPKSIEVLVDLFNYAVNHLDKQIIVITHSWDVLKGYCSDVGQGSPRGNQHEEIKPEDFKLITMADKLKESKIQEYKISDKKFADVKNHLKELWG